MTISSTSLGNERRTIGCIQPLFAPLNPIGVRHYRPPGGLIQREIIDKALSQLTPWGVAMILAAIPFGRESGRTLAVEVTCDLFMYAFIGI